MAHKISSLELIILVLTVHRLVSFFGQPIVPTGGFIDMPSVIIVVLNYLSFFVAASILSYQQWSLFPAKAYYLDGLIFEEIQASEGEE